MLVIKMSLHLINMQPLPSEGLVQATEISSLDIFEVSTTAFGQLSEYVVNNSSCKSKMPLSAASSSFSGSADIKNLVNFLGMISVLSACNVTETKNCISSSCSFVLNSFAQRDFFYFSQRFVSRRLQLLFYPLLTNFMKSWVFSFSKNL